MNVRVRLARYVALGLLLATTARAWLPLVINLWPDGPINVGFELTSTAPRNASGDWAAASAEAVAAWNSHLQRVQLVALPITNEPFYENRRNEVFFDRQLFSHEFPSGVLAATLSSFDRETRVETEIVFNTAYTWGIFHGPVQPGSGPLQPRVDDFRRVLVHELGHLLGLDHPDEYGQTVEAVMNSHESSTELPTADDIAGAHALYDQGSGAPPVIRDPPEAMQVTQGTAASLFVGAGGRGPLSYEWLRNGASFGSPNSETLSFAAVTAADEADYSVIVRNGAGSVTSRVAHLMVKAARPPSASLRGNEFLGVGDSVTLNADAGNGDAPLRYEWRKDGAIIDGATNRQLPLLDVQFSDAGRYTVTIANVAGSSTSQSITVSIEPAVPPRLTADLRSAAVAPLGTFFLEANALGSGPLTYQWQKDGVDIPGARDRTLVITDFNAAKAGRYTVIVTNNLGAITSAPAVISTFDAADVMIVEQPAAMSEFAGGTARFSVVAVPADVTYRWLKDGVPLTANGRIAGTQSANLIISGVGVDDVGSYAAEISLGGRVARSQGARFFLRTLDQATIRLQPAAHTLPVGGQVNLSVFAYSPDPARPLAYVYQWVKDGVALPDQTRSTCSFVATAPDAGRYSVRVALNGVTTESDPADVEITTAPRIITAHPASQLFEPDSEQLRLIAITDDIARRRAEQAGIVYTYRRGNVPLQTSPYGLGESLPGTYTLTATSGSYSETSRPFTLGYVDSGKPVIRRHPTGGAFILGAPMRLSVDVTSDKAAIRFCTWRKNGQLIGTSPTVTDYVVPAFSESDVGLYTVNILNDRGDVTSEPALVEIRGLQTPVILQQPVGGILVSGGFVGLSVTTRSGSFRYQWSKDGRLVAGATNAELVVQGNAANVGEYTVTVTDGTVSATSNVAVLRLRTNAAPTILKQPVNATAPAGGDVSFIAIADGEPIPTRYQWRRDGVDIPGASDAKLRLHDVQPGAAGAYSVVISNSLGSITSQPATLKIDPSGRLVNLATRAAVGRGNDILIAGFVVGGTEPRNLLIRAIGDQLSEFGVAGVLRDTVISVYDAKAKLLATNDDWFRGTEAEKEVLITAAREAGAFPQRDGARDGAVLLTLAPGSYTAQVTGFFNTTGVALVEVYEVGRPGLGRLINLSSRAVVGTGADILIPGIVVSGAAPRRLLIRAVGPALSDFGVSGALGDPTMTVYRDATVIAQNDNWSDQPDSGRIVTAMASVGAFGLKSGSRDAALLLDLVPGSYTVQVTGVGGSTGIALVEVYEVAP